MSELPTILVTNGWKTDRNRKLTSVTIPSTVKTLNAPTKVTFMGTTMSAVPSTADALQELEAPNATTIPVFRNYTKLKAVNASVITLPAMNGSGTFMGCTELQSVNLPNLVSISSQNTSSGESGAFCGCTSLTSITLPSLATESATYANAGRAGAFMNCTALQYVNFPVLASTTTVYSSGTFKGCTALSEVILGSPGHAVTSLGTNTFNGCTQSGLTITIYTANGASLANSPWGATNATIVYETA